MRHIEQVKIFLESSCVGTLKRHMHVLVITLLLAKYHIILQLKLHIQLNLQYLFLATESAALVTQGQGYK